MTFIKLHYNGTGEEVLVNVEHILWIERVKTDSQILPVTTIFLRDKNEVYVKETLEQIEKILSNRPENNNNVRGR